VCEQNARHEELAGKQDAALLPLLAHLRLQQAYYRGQRTAAAPGESDAEGPAEDELAYAGAVDVHALAEQLAQAAGRAAVGAGIPPHKLRPQVLIRSWSSIPMQPLRSGAD
jgi:hypothetical protein